MTQPERQEPFRAEPRPLGPAAARAAATMERSLTVPAETATLSVPARMMVENRLLANDHLLLAGADRISFTHLIAFAVVRACACMPAVNAASGGEGWRSPVNLGVLVDVTGADGRRHIRAPSIKRADEQSFGEFRDRYDDLVRRARAQELLVSDCLGTTISLTNPGALGTTLSVPRLMPRQRMVVGAGAVGFPADLAGMPEPLRCDLAVSEVVNLTATYEARALTATAAGEFLRTVADLLTSDDNFYTEVLGSLGVPVAPYRWARDLRSPGAGQRLSCLIDAYRRHRHRGAIPHGDLGFARLGFTVWDLPRSFYSETMNATAPLREIIRTLRLSHCYGHWTANSGAAPRRG